MTLFALDRLHLILLSVLAVLFAANAVYAQEHRERTLDEIKTEALKRAENGMYPVIGLDPADLREAFASIKTTDKDEWAAAFIAVGDRYMAEGKSLESSDPPKANADYIRAWRIYSFGRWPVPSSPGKQRAYAKALEAFRAHAKFWDPPLEIVHIPFEGSEIIGYLRLPKNTNGPVPLLIAVNGLDSRKEDLSESFSAILPFGIGFLAVDGPGTGQAPIKVSPSADRMLSRVIDYVQTRPEIDKTQGCDARCQLGRLLGSQAVNRGTRPAEGGERAIAPRGSLLSSRFSDQLAFGEQRIFVRPSPGDDVYF